MQKLKIGNSFSLDLKIAIAVIICYLLTVLFPLLQFTSASFAVILCLNNQLQETIKTSLSRVILTVCGGLAGVIVVLVDDFFQNNALFICSIFLGVLVTFIFCHWAKLPYIFSRIGVITFILVITVQTGEQRIIYCLLRILSTVLGIIIALLITKISILTSTHRQQINGGKLS
ncbi:FUSC family protein [Enterococcus sp. LJL120]